MEWTERLSPSRHAHRQVAGARTRRTITSPNLRTSAIPQQFLPRHTVRRSYVVVRHGTAGLILRSAPLDSARLRSTPLCFGGKSEAPGAHAHTPIPYISLAWHLPTKDLYLIDSSL